MIDLNLEDITINIEILRLFFSSVLTYFIFIRIINCKIDFKWKNIIINIIFISILDIISFFIKHKVDDLTSIIMLIFSMSLLFSINMKTKLGYSILYCTISFGLSYIIFFISIIITFFINIIYTIKSDLYNFLIIILIELIIFYKINKIKKIRNGISFLNKGVQDEFLNLILLNISVIVIFSFIVIVNADKYSIISRSYFVMFFSFAIIMFITIQKSIQLYYKQKLLIKDLNETKKELEDKNKEIELLEEENLNFSKKSHSLAHKQKVIEHKINKFLLKTECAAEFDLKDKVEEISKELYKDAKYSYISKIGVKNIDDMLETMQEECKKNNIEFNLQICGNIFRMINNFVEKEDLEILLADHIKDAIIAINHSDNINRTILVKIGKMDECYGVYFYDSGVEFDKEVLENLGKKPITTYINEGGTGMGFMNTFDTLKKYNASLIIKHLGKPSKENFTKIIMIKFDENANFCLTN